MSVDPGYQQRLEQWKQWKQGGGAGVYSGMLPDDPSSGSGGKKNAPPPGDYMGSAQEDFLNSRPNQTNAFGSSSSWTVGPDGRPVQTQSFGGPFGALSSSLQNQAAGNMSSPMDWSQFGTLQDGSAARDQAITAAYNQSASRLNPQWAARDESMQAQLANQGLDPQTSAAGRMAQFQQGQAKNDAYTSAMNSAIMQGQAAGDSVFRNNMMSRQQAISEALKKRGQPMEELQRMQGFLSQPGVDGGSNFLQADLGLGNYNLNAWQAQNEAQGDIFGGMFGGAGKLLGGLFGGRK